MHTDTNTHTIHTQHTLYMHTQHTQNFGDFSLSINLVDNMYIGPYWVNSANLTNVWLEIILVNKSIHQIYQNFLTSKFCIIRHTGHTTHTIHRHTLHRHPFNTHNIHTYTCMHTIQCMEERSRLQVTTTIYRLFYGHVLPNFVRLQLIGDIMLRQIKEVSFI